MKKISLMVVFLGCVLALSAQTSQPQTSQSQTTQTVADPWIGTWKLDLSQSQLHNPAPRDQTVRVESAGQGVIRYTASGTDADGKPFLESFDGKSDGQTYPVAVNGREGGQMSYQQVSDHQFTGQGKMTDGTAMANTVTLSPDGKTITIKTKGTTSQGSFDETAVFVKQQQ